jgi:hypothetical protein
MSDTHEHRSDTTDRLAALGDPEEAARVDEEPRPETPGDIPVEAPEADAVEQKTSVVEDDPGQVWEPGPEESDAADSTEQKRALGTPDEDEYR